MVVTQESCILQTNTCIKICYKKGMNLKLKVDYAVALTLSGLCECSLMMCFPRV